MKLQNKLPHMRDKAVLVNGTKYPIDEKGMATVTKKEDIAKLLLGSAWTKREGKSKSEEGGVIKTSKTPKAPEPPKTASEQTLPPPAPPAGNESPVAAETAAEPGSELGVGEETIPSPDNPEGLPPDEKETLEDPDSADTPSANDGAEAENDGVGTTTSGEESEDDSDEWPDPNMTMSKEYLQTMAEAYEIDIKELTKQDLVTAIKGKMYD